MSVSVCTRRSTVTVRSGKAARNPQKNACTHPAPVPDWEQDHDRRHSVRTPRQAQQDFRWKPLRQVFREPQDFRPEPSSLLPSLRAISNTVHGSPHTLRPNSENRKLTPGCALRRQSAWRDRPGRVLARLRKRAAGLFIGGGDPVEYLGCDQRASLRVALNSAFAPASGGGEAGAVSEPRLRMQFDVDGGRLARAPLCPR